MKSFAADFTEQPFLCPECGGEQAYNIINVSPIFDPDDPITNILEWISCKQCGAEIPAHIAERWNGCTNEQAQKEWLDTYRDSSQQARFDDAAARFDDKFGFPPFFDGMSNQNMISNSFIEKVKKAVDMNEPGIDRSDYFPDDRNL
ncbi:MAG: hypothetical protein GQ547_10045 [Methylophaga sp.]|nr:hypothetical protein [Methylophaga sp.]